MKESGFFKRFLKILWKIYAAISVVITTFIIFSIISLKTGSDGDKLGGGYYYIQDSPGRITIENGKIIIPAGGKDEKVVRVQFNDSIIIATCTPQYSNPDSTMYVIEKSTGKIMPMENIAIDINESDFKDIKSRLRYEVFADSWKSQKQDMSMEK